LGSAPGATGPSSAQLQTALWGRSSSTSYVFLGVEAVALYSYLRSRGADRAAAETDPSGQAGGVSVAGSAPGGAATSAPASLDGQGVDFLASLSRDHRAMSEWRGVAGAGPAAAPDGSAQVAPTGAAMLRFVNHVADRISGVTSALRGLQLTSWQVSDNTRLRLDARTGRQKRFFFILTSRF
jgi:hypothetical protein